MPARKDIEFAIDENGCHICTSHTMNMQGYTMITREGKFQQMHRYLFKISNGDIPNQMVIRHKCDNSSCINIEHLELGTHQDNMNDMTNRNRSLKGEKNHKAVLTEEDIRAIRSDKTSTNIALANIFGVTHSMISLIRLNKSWKHVV